MKNNWFISTIILELAYIKRIKRNIDENINNTNKTNGQIKKTNGEIININKTNGEIRECIQRIIR